MAKIQIYAERCNTRINLIASFIFGVLIAFGVLFYTLYYDNVFTPLSFVIALSVLYAFCLYQIAKHFKDFKDDSNRISQMIEAVKEGKELPQLSELGKWKSIKTKNRKRNKTE